MALPTHRASIFERCCDVKQRLEILKDEVENETQSDRLLTQPNAVDDILDRYLLWAGNLGVLYPPTDQFSLERLLSIIPEARDQMYDFLDDILNAINEWRDKLPVNRLDQTDMTAGNLQGELKPALDHHSAYEETQTMIEVVSLCVRSLFRMSDLVQEEIHKSQSLLGFQEWDVVEASNETTCVQQQYKLLSLEKTRWLAERLGTANARRRRQIVYWHDRKAQSEVYRKNTPVQERAETSSTDTPMDVESAASLGLPSLKVLALDGMPFECPICAISQSFQSEGDWVFHALSDLRAYVCTAAESECMGKMFSSRDAWVDHELLFHRSRYTCVLCGEYIGSRAIAESHISSVHGAFQTEQIKALVDTGRVVPTYFEARDCPFCFEWAKSLRSKAHTEDKSVVITDGKLLVARIQFMKHIATHQERLAASVVSHPRRSAFRVTTRHETGESSTIHTTPTAATSSTALTGTTTSESSARPDKQTAPVVGISRADNRSTTRRG
ncbi:hypothetical protein F4813DRAFT_88792 [Daldinia decipiens]|uniref:uncharacterized protein n=1 Tax=Daldinia decipiens TaxID=326647 RepID=UPI0020C20E1B|nr:uncharacterized protein F4813DRAFT_88792 [Daldinia decipiens]KAI1657023.1 hypothetical protein F4813DRAFT_88792 [Daldinia decipiens]